MPRQRGVWEERAWGPPTLGSSGTGAFVGIDQVNAGAPVLARLGEALIDLHRAVGPQVAWHALRDRGRKEGGKHKEERRRREGKVQSIDMKQRQLLFTWLFSGIPPPKASTSFTTGEINIPELFVFYL